MTYKFVCPHCDQHISAEPDVQGAAVNCPTCAGAFVAPAFVQPPPQPQSEPLPEPPDLSTGRKWFYIFIAACIAGFIHFVAFGPYNVGALIGTALAIFGMSIPFAIFFRGWVGVSVGVTFVVIVTSFMWRGELSQRAYEQHRKQGEQAQRDEALRKQSELFRQQLRKALESSLPAK